MDVRNRPKSGDAPDTAKTQKVTVVDFRRDMTLEVIADGEKLYGVNVLSNSKTEEWK